MVKDDVFGAKASVSPFTFNYDQVQNVGKQAWRFHTADKKLTAFNKWFQQRVKDSVLDVDTTGKPWLAKYVESSYKTGALRAYTDAHPELGIESPDFYRGSKEQFLKSAFGAPERVSKLKLLYTRTFEELKGITAVMSQQVSKQLAQGIADGKNPLDIARGMSKTIDGISKSRARTIARTEMIYAHAEGQLDAFEDLGVDELDIMAEWNTAGDDRVCDECQPLEGVLLSVDEARGLLPRHPNCRCAWIPANIGEKQKGEKRGKAAEEALRKSIKAEGGSKMSDWLGKELVK